MGVPKPSESGVCNTQFAPEIVKGVQWIPLENLHVHETTNEERHQALVKYMNVTLQQQEGAMTITAISVSKEGVVIDGHHRLESLKSLGYNTSKLP